MSDADESRFSYLKRKEIPNIDSLWGILFSVCYLFAETKSFLFLFWRITASFKTGLEKYAGGKVIELCDLCRSSQCCCLCAL